MTVYENQTFANYFDRDSRRTFSDLVFRRCRFENCRLSTTDNFRLRSVIRNVKLYDCEQLAENVTIDCAILDSVLVDGLKTNQQLISWATAFRHVTLRGKIGELFLNDIHFTKHSTVVPKEAWPAIRDANKQFYHDVDWALDISEAEFRGCDVRGVPARLIRRNPATQAVVTREKALLTQDQWSKLEPNDPLRAWLRFRLAVNDDPDWVFVVATRSKSKYSHTMETLKRLRDMEIAEPD